jgi:hypothetical protein
MTLTLAEAQRDLADAVKHALQGESVLITVGSDSLRLAPEVPMRPPGYFAEYYNDPDEAAFEERICKDSVIAIEP